MSRCTYASSGCNGPSEGQCMTLCHHRVNTDLMTRRVVAVHGSKTRRPLTSTPIAPRPLVAYRLFRFYLRGQRHHDSNAEHFRFAMTCAVRAIRAAWRPF